MTVKQHSNGKWYCRFSFRGKDMHRLCRGATTKSKAEEIERAIIYDLELQEHGYKVKELKNIYFRRLKELYTSHAINNHKRFRNQVYYINSLERYFGNSKPVNDITPEDIEKYKAHLRNDRKLKNSSINRYLEILSKMFNLAIDNDLLTENPVRKAGMLREDNISVRFLLIEEQKRLYKSVDEVAPYLRPIITMALHTGMRKGEILNLKWSNIKCGFIELLETKSGKMRSIPISPILRDVLNQLPKVSEYIFVNPKTNRPYTDIKKSWHKVLNNAGIENLRFHDLRHTVATRMVEQGADLLVVKDILGHTMIETTMRYAHPVPANKRAAVNSLSNYNNQER